MSIASLDAPRAHLKKCTAGKKSQSMMEKPRPRAAKKSNDSDLQRQNRNEIANGISLRRKTPLAWPEASTCMGMPGAIR